MQARGTICETDLAEAAMLFGALQNGRTFTAAEYSAWARIGAVEIEEEQANEILLGIVEKGLMREIGPGVYALADSGKSAPLQHPIFSEGEPANMNRGRQ